ncbi:MAG: GNAT family N-acetyltransferase [Proteobacteria bacterium]|nr:GNAT family N-acetyltransferase [Pseudomonadota bacterium]
MHEGHEVGKPFARVWMKAATGRFSSDSDTAPSGVPVRSEYAEAIGLLMKRAYEGTIDDEGETLDQCIQEIRDTIAGKYGPFLKDASFIACFEDRIVSASLVTMWKGKPLLAYSMTDPDCQRCGLAGSLIRMSLNALADAGISELFLVVTVGNHAQNLYSRLGFKILGSAPPQQPPPS